MLARDLLLPPGVFISNGSTTVAIPSSGQIRAARSLDVFIAVVVLGVLSPLLALRALAGWLACGSILERTPARGRHASPLQLLTFSGPWGGARWARWLNVLSGSLAIGGPGPAGPEETPSLLATAPARFAVRPGLFTVAALQRMTGIDHGDESTAELAFVEQFGAFSGVALAFRSMLASTFTGGAPGLAPRRIRILGVRLDNVTMTEAVKRIVQDASSGRPATFFFGNADCLNIASTDSRYRKALAAADVVFADGIGLRIAARLLGQRLLANVNGTDMFPLLCSDSARAGVSIYLLGGRPGVAHTAARAMEQAVPGLRVAGSHHGYFSDEEQAGVIADINRSGAGILLVGLGAPRQELWIREHESRLAPSVKMGVGGLFDYYSGRIPRAPLWLRQIGLEWVWRLGQEPSRLWRRYVLGNCSFLYRVVRSHLQGGHRPAAAAITGTGPLQRRLAQGRGAWLRVRPLISNAVTRLTKRSLDVVLSLLGLVAISPLLLVIALAIKLDSRGPVIFRQQRVGRDGRTFRMFKFRSMHLDAEARISQLLARNEMEGGVIFKMRHDPRVTRVGRFIRRTSIDELPQLLNVLRGDMSLVGPRPPLPREVAEYSPSDRRRLDAEPGITCIWQVSGRSEIPFPVQVEMDLQYIHRQSLGEDLRLLARTVPALLRGRGAY